MSEAEETIPETPTIIQENEATIVENTKKGPENSEGAANNLSEAEPAPTPKRGRPAGSKDKAPRRKVRVEPIPQEEELQPTPAAKPKAAPPPPAPRQQAALAAPVRERQQCQPSPERSPPPSPRTMYRQTSAHLVSLRDMTHNQRRSKVAEQYTHNLHSWVV